LRTRFGIRKDLRQLRGFSLLELVIVMAIMLVIGAMVAPKFTTMISSYRLKSTASDVSGILQRCRMQSIRSNRAVPVLATTDNGRQQLYADVNLDGARSAGEPTFVMPQKVTLQATGPADATTGLNSAATRFYPGYSTSPRFNARGLPCVVIGSVCKSVDAATKQVGFVYYLKSDNVFGQTQWAAVTVTPGGRIRSWIYSGSTFQ
jgi:prepilin-type N-terminal cleavage/methylation domain-containing protein